MCLRWILELPPAKLEEVLGELRWLHPQSLEDLPDNEAAELMSRYGERGLLAFLEILCVHVGAQIAVSWLHVGIQIAVGEAFGSHSSRIVRELSQPFYARP